MPGENTGITDGKYLRHLYGTTSMLNGTSGWAVKAPWGVEKMESNADLNIQANGRVPSYPNTFLYPHPCRLSGATLTFLGDPLIKARGKLRQLFLILPIHFPINI